MTYTVKYKRPGQWFFRTIKKVKGDLVATDVPGNPRVFILEDESRVEVPSEGLQLIFSHERFLIIKQRMEQEAGQRLPLREP